MLLVLRASLVWLGLCALAYVNGALREVIIKAQMGIADRPAHQLSVVTGIALWTRFTSSLWGWLAVPSLAAAALIGLGWLVATLFFETFVLERSMTWEQILQTYNFAAGELWGIVVLWIGVMPVVLFLVFQ